MNKQLGHRIVLTAAAGLSLSIISPFSWAQECKTAGHVETVTGLVEIRKNTDTPWRLAEQSLQLCEDHQLRTGDNSKATIKLVNSTLVNLGSNTALNLTEVDTKSDSLLDLLQGIIHTLSRVPRSLEIRTPYVNAGIEGTEFVVDLDGKGTEVSVLEGLVRTYNQHGEVLLTNNEASFTAPGEAPQKRININPYNAVSWVLSYPPLLEFGKDSLNEQQHTAYQQTLAGKPDSALKTLTTLKPSENTHLLKAVAYLTAGNEKAATQALGQIEATSSRKQAVESTIALSQNDLATARKKADAAIKTNEDQAEAWLAKSYVEQADFNIDKALKAAKLAEQKAPNNALVKARVAELLQMQGKTGKALKKALDSALTNSAFDVTHISMGFAQLQDRKPKQAIRSFQRAMELNPGNPRTRLGLGLGHIKQGDLETGRQWLESAALLSPTDSLLRSYLGKTYFEENRYELSAEQLELAKQFDPKDPTPWFYESVLLQNENRLVEALTSMEQSIALNDQRAVYRSRLLLDDDKATRNAGLGSLYQQLGFEQQGTSLAADSLAQDPTNPAAHQLLANSYLDDHRSNVARVNEMRQAQLFGEIGQQIIKPQLLRNHKALLDDGGPGSLGHNEHNRLLQSDGPYLNLSATGAGNSTWGNDLTTGYIGNNYALHLGQYHYETDGFGSATGYEEDATVFQLQWQIHRSVRLELDASKDEVERQSAGLRYTEDFINPTRKNETEYDKVGASLILNLSPSDKLILRTSKTDGEERTRFEEETFPGFPYGYDVPIDIENKRDHIQYSHSRNNHSILVGAQRTRKDNTSTHKLFELGDTCDFPGCYYESSGESQAEDRRYYAYWYATQPEHGLTITTGLEIARRFEDEDKPTERELLPKFGIGLQTSENTRVNLALFKALSSPIDANLFETLGPTQVAGFNQIFTGQENAPSDNYGLSLEHRFAPDIRTGVRYSYHKDTAVLGQLQFLPDGFAYVYKDSDTRIKQASAWLYWTPTDRVGVSLEILDERFDDQQEQLFNDTSDNVENLHTTKIPVAFNYHHPSGVSTNLTATYMKQKGTLWLNNAAIRADTPINADENFTLVDLSASYRLPNRRGTVSVGVKNAFDKEFNFEDTGSYNPLGPQDTGVPSVYASERLWFASASLNF